MLSKFTLGALAMYWLLAPLASSAHPGATYRNPLALRLAGGELAQNCGDPAVLRAQGPGEQPWYLYCTSDPVSHAEKDGDQWRFRQLPVYRSTDLVNWSAVGDAFPARPPVAMPTAGLWAPEPHYFKGRYYLYFTITDVPDRLSPEPGCGGDSAIGVASSDSPEGPWEASPALVVAPRRAGPGCNFHWTFDPRVVHDADGGRVLYYGSYGGGIYVQPLAPDGMSVTGDAVLVGASGRYEGAEVVRHGAYWYLFASATDCCNGPLTGYTMYVGRASRPQGPFLDRLGNDMAAPRAGGTPLLAQNGNRWVGAGHNSVFPDAAGQWWTIYHAIDRDQPFFSVKDKLTRRLAMLDRIDWVDGWPVANGGRGPSDEELPAPLASRAGAGAGGAGQAGGQAAGQAARPLWSDRFRTLDPAWSWTRPRPADGWSLGAGGLSLATEAADLYVDINNASLLARPLPSGDYRVELELRLDAPLACCATPVQAGMVIYRDDDNYVKLVELAHNGLRQVEFGKELGPVQAGYPRYGNTVIGTPGQTTWLRIDVVQGPLGQRYTASSSQDGRRWVRGGTWTHELGPAARLGLVAMGGTGHRARIRQVSVSALRQGS
jgi:arabinan endo-1,5-alpha-L-arabinosidase